jgi:septum formation protein
MMNVILASGSPRRKELLSELIDEFKVIPADTDEVIDESLDIHSAIEKIALEKALDVSMKYPEALTIGADTIVYSEGEVLLKPVDFDDAFRILKKLSVSKQQVITGVALCKGDHCKTFVDETVIEFQNMDDDWITNYITEFKPFDKSGSYGIQEIDNQYIKTLTGDITNVIGLPILRLSRELENNI